MSEQELPEMAALIKTLAHLRQACAWDREQTHESLAKYLTEESQELVEAIESGDRANLLEELGDVLYQVLFHADIAANATSESFDIEDISRAVRLKMERRHPHVFGSEVAETAKEVSANWQKWKAAEKASRTSPFDN